MVIGKYTLLMLVCIIAIISVSLKIKTSKRRFELPAILFSGLFFVMFMAMVFDNLCSGTFSDHLEPTVLSNSLALLHGLPMYPSQESGHLYGMVYGPLQFWVDVLPMALAPHSIPSGMIILLSKIPSVIAVFLYLLLFWILLGRTRLRGRNRVMAWFLFVVIGLIPFANEFIWIRGEPFLLLLTLLSLYVVTGKKSPVTQAVLLGVIAGLLSGFKLHGPLSALPAALFLLHGRDLRGYVRLIVCMAVPYLLVLFFPFVIGGVSLQNYLSYLELTAHHELNLNLIVLNINFALLFCGLFYLFMARGTDFLRKYRFECILMVPVFLLTIVVASKTGSGPHHLEPLLASVLFLSFYMVDEKVAVRNLYSLPVILLVSVFVFSFRSYGVAKDIFMGGDQSASVAALDHVLQRYPDGVVIPSGGTQHDDALYRTSFLRVIQVAWNGRYEFDPGMYMDWKFAGVDDNRLIRRLNACTDPVFISPTGGIPWHMNNNYTKKPLYSHDVYKVFSLRYKKVESGKIFTVWQCRS